MELEGQLFSAPLLTGLWLLYLALAALALWLAPWARLRDSRQMNVFLGSCVGLMVLWALRTDVQPGLEYHLLGVTTLTLLFGWSLGVLGASLALLGVNLTGFGDWSGFGVSALLVAVVPATVTQFILVLVRSYLPRHFFIYVFINAFLAAGLSAAAGGFSAVAALVASGAYTLAELQQTYMPFFPLMCFPESLLNGWAVTLAVAFRPEWVASFRDEEYLVKK